VKKKQPIPQRIPINELLSSNKTRKESGANLVLDLIKAIEVRKMKIKPSSFLTKKVKD
jgi:hypothetical protein